MRNQKNENQIKSNDRDETGKKSTQDKKKPKQLKIKRIRITLYKKRNKRKLVYFNKEKNREKWKVKKKSIGAISSIFHHHEWHHWKALNMSLQTQSQNTVFDSQRSPHTPPERCGFFPIAGACVAG